MQMSPKTVNYGGENLGFGDGRFLQKNLGFGVGFGYRNNARFRLSGLDYVTMLE